MSERTFDQADGAAEQANSAVSPGQASGQQEPSGAEVFITKQEFEAFQRQIQSQTDKAIHNSMEARLKQLKADIDKTLKANRAAGIEISPEKEAMLRQKMLDQVLFEDEAPSAPKGQGQESQDDYAWITEAADDIMEEYGVHIPVRELRQLPSSNPAEYLKQVRMLAKQKSAGRATSAPQPEPTKPPDTRTFLGSSIGGVPTPETQETLRDAYLKEVNEFKAAHPRATVEQLFEIREKWLSKGWNGITR